MRFQWSKFLASSSFFWTVYLSYTILNMYRHRRCESWDGSTTKREYTFCEQGNPNLSSFFNFSINNSCLSHSFIVDFVLSSQLKDSGAKC
jgi:hypothetical protein